MPNARRRPAAALCAATAALCALAAAAPRRAAAEPSAACAASPRGDVTCAVDLRDALDAEIAKRLKSGFQNVLLYRIYIRRASDGEPVALTVQRHLQIYELWDDVFYLYRNGSRADSRAHRQLPPLLDEVATFKILAAEQLPPGAYYADVILELNPLSEAEEAEIRAWIARSRGGHRTFATGDRSFFGTFVSLFVNIRPGSAELTVRQASPRFEVPPPAPGSP